MKTWTGGREAININQASGKFTHGIGYDAWTIIINWDYYETIFCLKVRDNKLTIYNEFIINSAKYWDVKGFNDYKVS